MPPVTKKKGEEEEKLYETRRATTGKTRLQ